MNTTSNIQIGDSAGAFPREGATAVWVDVISRGNQYGQDHRLLVNTESLRRDAEWQYLGDSQYLAALSAGRVAVETLGRVDDGNTPIPVYSPEDVGRAVRFAAGRDVLFALEERPLGLWRAAAHEGHELPPLVAALYRSGNNKPEHEIGDLLAGIAGGLIAGATVDSDASRDTYVGIGVPRDKIHVIHNGIDTHRFTPSAEERKCVREELGIGTDDPTILYVARLSPEKGVPLFLQAANEYLRRVPGGHIIMAGTGLSAGNPEMAELIQRFVSDDPEISRRLHALGPRKDFPAMYPASDVLAVTSETESRPLCISEAFASGMGVVVSTDVGDARQMIGAHGIITGRDPGEIAEAWIEAYSNREAMGFDIRNRDSLGVEPMAKEYARVLAAARETTLKS